MEIKRMNGMATVTLTPEDCALLAEACRGAVDRDLFSGEDETLRGAYCSALGSAFEGLALACAAEQNMPPAIVREWHRHLAEMGVRIEV